MRRTHLSLLRLLTEQDDHAAEQEAFESLMRGDTTIQGPPEEPGAPPPPPEKLNTQKPKTPAELEEAARQFLEKAAAAKEWMRINTPDGVRLSAELLNAKEGTLTELGSFAQKAIDADAGSDIPLHQMAAASLIVPPGVGWTTINDLFGVFTGTVELFAARSAFAPGVTMGAGGKVLVALPGVLAGVETAFRYAESPLKTDDLPPSEINIEDVPTDIFKESFKRNADRRKYKLAKILNEATLDDANVKAVLKQLLGAEVLTAEGSLAEKIFIKLLRDSILDDESALGMIIERVRVAAARLKKGLLTNDDLKKFITEHADEIFDADEIVKYTDQVKKDVKKIAVVRAAKDLAEAGTSAESVIETIIKDLEDFYAPMGGTVTDTEKAGIANILRQIYSSGDLTPEARLRRIVDVVKPAWVDKFEQILTRFKEPVFGSRDQIISRAEILNNEIVGALDSSFDAFGFNAGSGYKIAVPVADIKGKRVEALYEGIQYVETDVPGTFTLVIEATDRATNETVLVPVDRFLESWRNCGVGVIAKAQTADRAFQAQMDNAVNEIAGVIDAELVTKQPKDWAEFLNRAIDKSGETNLLDASLEAISSAANVATGLGRTVKTGWRGVGEWATGAKQRQSKLAKSPGDLTEIQRAIRERSIGVLLLTALFDSVGESVANEIYVFSFADTAIFNNYTTFLGMTVTKDPAKALAANALEVAKKIVLKFSTGSTTGAGPIQASPENQIVTTSTAWQTIYENIDNFASKLPDRKKAQSTNESARRLRALIRESLLADSQRPVRG